MAIYLFTLLPEGFKELDLKPGETYADHNCLRWSGDAKRSSWKTPELVWFNDEFTQGSDIDGDFLKFHGGAPVVSAKAYAALSPMLQNFVEFLPVIVDGEQRYLMNVTRVLDLMDASKSKFKIYSDGQIGACQHAHLNELDENQLIFKVKGYFPRVFINEAVKREIEKLGLSGALIREYINP